MHHATQDPTFLTELHDLLFLIGRVDVLARLAILVVCVRELVQHLVDQALVEAAGLVDHDELVGGERGNAHVVHDFVAEILAAVLTADVHASDRPVQCDDLDEVVAVDESRGDRLLIHRLIHVVLVDPLHDLDGTVIVGVGWADEHRVGMLLHEDVPGADTLLTLGLAAQCEQLVVVGDVADLGEVEIVGAEVGALDLASWDRHLCDVS